MKEIKYNLGTNKNIIMQIPDDVDMDIKTASGMIAITVQDQVVNGNITVTQRVWPCFYCNRSYKAQMTLAKHLDTHTEMIENIKDNLAWLK